MLIWESLSSHNRNKLKEISKSVLLRAFFNWKTLQCKVTFLKTITIIFVFPSRLFFVMLSETVGRTQQYYIYMFSASDYSSTQQYYTYVQCIRMLFFCFILLPVLVVLILLVIYSFLKTNAHPVICVCLGSGSEFKTAYACEGGQLFLSCQTGEVIRIFRANYGRFTIALCNHHGQTEGWNLQCMSPKAKDIISER